MLLVVITHHVIVKTAYKKDNPKFYNEHVSAFTKLEI